MIGGQGWVKNMGKVTYNFFGMFGVKWRIIY